MKACYLYLFTVFLLAEPESGLASKIKNDNQCKEDADCIYLDDGCGGQQAINKHNENIDTKRYKRMNDRSRCELLKYSEQTGELACVRGVCQGKDTKCTPHHL